MNRDAGGGIQDAFTLVEVIVVLTIMGVVLGISGLALASLKAPREADQVRALREARSQAIRSGHPVSASAVCSLLPAPCSVVLFLPDGRAVGPGVDPLTGMPNGTR